MQTKWVRTLCCALARELSLLAGTGGGTVMDAVVQILHAMQQARVIHTDLKPDNCLLSWPAAISANNLPAPGRAPAWSAASASARGGHWGSGCLQVHPCSLLPEFSHVRSQTSPLEAAVFTLHRWNIWFLQLTGCILRSVTLSPTLARKRV